MALKIISILMPISIFSLSSNQANSDVAESNARISIDNTHNLKNNETNYRNSFLDPNGAFAKAKILHAVHWAINERNGVMLLLQLNDQCRVVNFDTSSATNQGQILLDTPWCKLKSPPVAHRRNGMISFTYKIQVKDSTTSEEIKLNEKTGEFCSDSFGNIDYSCQ